MKIERVRALSFEVDAVDVAFWDEDTLLVTTPSAELWRVAVEPRIQKAELVFAADQILDPVSRALGTVVASPASGGYPRLAVSREAGVAAVNTHDMVLLACPLQGEGGPRLVSYGWGQYYPRMAFSPDASRLMVCDDALVVFDTGSWRWHRMQGDANICAWHPREPWLLGLEPTTGKLRWSDLQDMDNPRTWSAGALDPTQWDDDVVGIAIDATGERLVAAYRHPDRIEWWELDPLHRVDTRPVQAGEVLALEHGREAGLFAAVAELGVQLWGFESREPISDVIPDVSEVKFSPSGLCFVTLSRASDNPYPVAPSRTGCTSILWRASI
ncbi:hypothetical protein [Sorangium cellulosum]|uniref:WD40 repeat domain-containing protein n=1 Tax=Sorangium cellulosum TaxID=56 RepID=A0A150QPA3_SORCE|nr:hypothetical protein [Sorangium cellulosum]KYF69764.1 hypothetical protein BE15_10110 [Sorangium cellulosum]